MLAHDGVAIDPTLRDLYRDLHRHPELGFQEHRTAGIVAKRLRTSGYDVTEGVGGTGVVGVLRNGSGPTALLRADMDALPIAEDTGLDYASTATARNESGALVPVSHACGHDLHTTCLLGAAEVLSRDRAAWSGTLLLVFQPAEELGSGARAMIDDGLFARFPRTRCRPWPARRTTARGQDRRAWRSFVCRLGLAPGAPVRQGGPWLDA